MDRYEVCTTEGNLTNKGFDGAGLEEAEAQHDADRRNQKAKDMGLGTRYTIRPLGSQ